MAHKKADIMKAKRILAICLVMLLVTVALPLVVSADTSQSWFLWETSLDTDLYEMKKGSVDYPGPSSVSITTTSSVVWRADQTSQGCTFPAGTWDGEIFLKEEPSSGTITLDVGSWDGSFHSNGNTQSPDPTVGSNDISISADQFSVYSGDYLAFKVTNNTSGTIVVDCDFADQSYLTSPTSDPGYPIPELPTIVLLTTGLVCLAGYFGLKRRKKAYLKV